jgi:multisubunit Na+/H+ antiporter MnhB subunit
MPEMTVDPFSELDAVSPDARRRGGSGMYVSGYSARKPSLYDKNPLATMTLVAGFVAMVSNLIPSIGGFIAMPMGACTAILGVLGILSAKKRGNDRGDIAVAGIVLGGASIVVAIISLFITGSILYDSGTDSIAMAKSGDESLDALATMSARTDIFDDIVGNDWGTGETRTKSSEVISFKKDMSFMAWTMDYDGSMSTWNGVYSLQFDEEAMDVVPKETRDVIEEELEKTPKFSMRNVVTIQMEVNEVDGDRSKPVTLVMIGHYLKDEHKLLMRESAAPLNTPTVLNRLDDNESGIT